MKKYAWLTDIHLNFLERGERKVFYSKISATGADFILITGDISESTNVVAFLQEMGTATNKPIYFVAGNHDYYCGNVQDVREQLNNLSKSDNNIFWLPAVGLVAIDDLILLGQDGWGDGRNGNYANSPVVLNDSRYIEDLFQQKILGKYQLLEKMQELADNDANNLRVNLELALASNPRKIMVLTHVPPFKEACMYKGGATNEDWLPFYSSKASGDVLYQFALDNPQHDILVLCGHTHQYTDVQILPNLRVKVGEAEYYTPQVQEVLEL